MRKAKFETNKYPIGQRVWFMSDNRAQKANITAIINVQGKFRYLMDKYDYGQTINCNQGFGEEEIFATKEALLTSL